MNSLSISSTSCSRSKRLGSVERSLLHVLQLPFSAAIFFAFVSPGAAGEEVQLQVSGQPAQTIKGFGCSLVSKNLANVIPADSLTDLYDGIFTELKMNVLRLWVEVAPAIGMAEMKDAFVNAYVSSGAIKEAQKRGVSHLLLAPSYGPLKDETMPAYAARLAEFILLLRNEHGVEINASGVVNEPGLSFSPAQLKELVLSFRAELDKRGLQTVAIVAPESSGANSFALAHIEAIKSDPAAWKALSGIATHSYNMAATSQFPETIAGTGKDYWQTEAGFDGHEDLNDEVRAANISARFLNDVNSGVNYWIYFIGFSSSLNAATAPNNSGQLLDYDRATSSILRFLKCSYLRQLRGTFPNGSVMYRVSGNEKVKLDYTYGKKSSLNAAAAIRPDKKWAFAIVNNTGYDDASQEWPKSETIAVALNLPPELRSRNLLSFRIWRSSGTAQLKEEPALLPKGGQVKIMLKPHELVSLMEK